MPPVTLKGLKQRLYTPRYTNTQTSERVETALSKIPTAELQQNAGKILALYSDYLGVPYRYWKREDHPNKTLRRGRTTTYTVDVILQERKAA